MGARSPSKSPNPRNPSNLGAGELLDQVSCHQVIALRLAIVLVIPLGLDLYLPVPDEIPHPPKRSRWGGGCSATAASRATPRSPAHRATTPIARSPTVGRSPSVSSAGQGRRNAPALINRGYGRRVLLGRAGTSLEEQVLRPIQDPPEMDLTLATRPGTGGDRRGSDLSGARQFVRSFCPATRRYRPIRQRRPRALIADEQEGLQIFRRQSKLRRLPHRSELHR